MYKGSLGEVTTRETFSRTIEVVDDDGLDVNIASATISVALRLQGNTTANLSATVGDGITIDSGASPMNFTVTFSEEDMEGLDTGTYDFGCVITLSSVTTQLIAATVNIIDGIIDS